MRADIVGSTGRQHPDLNGIKVTKGTREARSPFLCLKTIEGRHHARDRARDVSFFYRKMHRYISPRQGSLDKQRLSSELDKEIYHAMHLAY